MKLAAFEGVVDNGVIQLEPSVRLPDRARVYVLVPESENRTTVRVSSPRLARPEQASDFRKRIVEAPSDAGL